MQKYISIIFIIIGVIIAVIVLRLVTNKGSIVPPTCSYYAQTYKNGEHFKADCNECSCTNGEIICTEKACGGS